MTNEEILDVAAKNASCIITLEKQIERLNDLLVQSRDTLDWMIVDMKKRFDDERSCFGKQVTGGYSEQLTKATELLEILRHETTSKQKVRLGPENGDGSGKLCSSHISRKAFL